MTAALDRRRFLGQATQAALLPLCGPALASFAQAPAEPSSPPAAPPTAQSAGLYWAWWGWEPIEHYRRTGGMVGAVDATAPAIDAWYDRLHSGELAATMARAGVNLAVTHFFKGFGLRHEKPQQQRTAELVRHARRHGIAVLGYCQSRSLYYETFLAEEPNARDWVQIDQDGKLRTWGSAYFRWTPCILCRPFRQYMQRAIRVGLEEVGLAGLHFDNDYCEACYCPRCQHGFRDWLRQQCPDPQRQFGLENFDHVQPPPLAKSPREVHDPLVIEWVRFRCAVLGDYHRELAAYARSLRPDVLLLGNPAYPREGDEPYRRSVWLPQIGPHLKLVFAENGNFPGLEKDCVISQIRAFKEGQALGYRVVSTTWQHNKLSGLGLPDRPEQVALQVAEAAAGGGVPGTNWALRPQGAKGGMQIDRPELRAVLSQYLTFARSTENYRCGKKPLGEVAVLRTLASQAFNLAGHSQRLAAEEVLIRQGFAWQALFGEQIERLTEFAVLVLAGQTHLSAAEVAAIRRFVDAGGGLVLVGDSGIYDDRGRRHASGALADLSGPRVVRLAETALQTTVDQQSVTRVALPKRAGQFADAVRRAADGRLSLWLQGNSLVALSAYDLEEGGWAAHLVNYATPQPAAGSVLGLGKSAAAARTVTLLRPDQQPASLPIESTAAGGQVKLPPLDVYAIVVGK